VTRAQPNPGQKKAAALQVTLACGAAVCLAASVPQPVLITPHSEDSTRLAFATRKSCSTTYLANVPKSSGSTVRHSLYCRESSVLQSLCILFDNQRIYPHRVTGTTWLPSSSPGEWYSGIHRRAMVDSGANRQDIGLEAYFAFAEIGWVYFWVYSMKTSL